MTPERIEELRDLFANYLTRSSDENKLLAFASEILDIAERFARIAAILEPLRALEAAATEGPWRWKKDSIDYGYVGPGGHPTVLYGENCEGAVSEDNPDGRLLAAARNALPALLREIQETP